MKISVKNKNGETFDFAAYADKVNLYTKKGKVRLKVLAREATTEELVDTAADIYQVVTIIVLAFSDGFDWQDVVVAIGQERAINEILADAPLAFEALKQLPVSEYKEAVQDIVAEVQGRGVPVSGFGVTILNGLYLVADFSEFVNDTFAAGKERYEMIAKIDDGKLIVPPKAA